MVAFHKIFMRCGHTSMGRMLSPGETPVDHFIGHIPIFYKKGIKDQIKLIKIKSV